MDSNRVDEHDEEYLSGLEGRDRWPIAEDMFERPLHEVKRRTWLHMDAGEKIFTAAQEMVSKKIGHVVVTVNEQLAGILTERDLLNHMVQEPFDPKETALGDLMTKGVTTLHPDDTVATAIHRMSQGGHRHIPLVDKDFRPVGLVSVRDIVDYLAVLFPHKILTLPPDTRKIPKTREGG